MRFRSIAAALCLVAPPGFAFAHSPPDVPEHMLSVGPSLAFAGKPGVGAGLGYGLDAALSWTILWAGAGVRAYENGQPSEREVLPYLEAGVYLIVNLGGGYTFDSDTTPQAMAGPHFFIGLPLPWNVHDNVSPVYFEPYYRSTYGSDGTLHEAGLLLKGLIILRK